MPLAAGRAEFNEYSSSSPWLYAFVDAAKRLPGYSDVFLDESPPEWPAGSRTSSFDLGQIGFKNWLLKTPPALSGFGIYLQNPSGTSGIIPTNNINQIYNSGTPYAKCIIACDNVMDSLLVTFYAYTGAANLNNSTLLEPKGPAIFFLAKDMEDGIFGGYGGPTATEGGGTVTNIIGESGIWFAGTVDYDTDNGVFSRVGDVTPSPSGSTNYWNKGAIFFKMPNYTKSDIPLAKSMMVSLVKPHITESNKRFSKYYSDRKTVNPARYANFSNYSESLIIPFIDPWCPF